ncbi:ribosomal RNA processing protein 36 homolog [Chironomus tepperi]|uniref:ribosomal RNA processing protein 36 homolog n=1 Tax=Chironomus tepperi TaxID=113505 RepID=UPI00391F21F7
MEEEVSFEALLKLRDQVGLKSFKEFESEMLFKNKSEKSQNKNKKSKNEVNEDDEAPLEISSKKPFKKNKNTAYRQSQPRTRDPRFDNRIGTFNEEKFQKNYDFAFKMRDQEVEDLKATQKNEEKPDKRKKFLIQRIENQKRENAKKFVNKARNSNKKVEVLSDGTKFYKTKKLQRTEDLVNKFLELKNSGKLEKHLDKRRKKIAGKERKKMNIEK